MLKCFRYYIWSYFEWTVYWWGAKRRLLDCAMCCKKYWWLKNPPTILLLCHFNFLQSKFTLVCPSFCLSETPLSDLGSICGRFASGDREKQGLLAFQKYRLSLQCKLNGKHAEDNPFFLSSHKNRPGSITATPSRNHYKILKYRPNYLKPWPLLCSQQEELAVSLGTKRNKSLSYYQKTIDWVVVSKNDSIGHCGTLVILCIMH